MLKVAIPGFEPMEFEHLVLDFNGTIAFDGKIINGVEAAISMLSQLVTVHIVTADTNQNVAQEVAHLPVTTKVVSSAFQLHEKLAYIEKLGHENVCAIGNGNVDKDMLERAELGIAILGPEGLSTKALLAADVLMPDIVHALESLVNSARLKATLRM
ncbi:HAD family hydrolase [Halodesulfovibrio marinisediminis]|uniref:Soluble P-type ATPase n=1 Tax=Halodesulfovibrio marinisediminis DSM 17456 TaxID=1121457 RepID=A0A1N6J2R9_9BACT|nr:HAD family hydrolase [Halodesulfovibrio marinisediminis]SIO38426.1 Soluble P-type ATPase [Halodesulfovibrio marinisediminis DSM 17456]